MTIYKIGYRYRNKWRYLEVNDDTINDAITCLVKTCDKVTVQKKEHFTLEDIIKEEEK